MTIDVVPMLMYEKGLGTRKKVAITATQVPDSFGN